MSQVLEQVVPKSHSPPPQDRIARCVQGAYSYCRRRLGDRELAQAAAVAAFIALDESGLTCLDAPGFELQLFRVTRIACQTILRPDTHLRRPEGEAATMNSSSSQIFPAGADLLRLLDRAIVRLSTSSREVVLLRFYGGKTWHQAAMELDLPVAIVERREAQAIATIRAFYRRYGCDITPDALHGLLQAAFSTPAPAHLVERVTSTLAGTVPVPEVVKTIVSATVREIQRPRRRTLRRPPE